MSRKPVDIKEWIEWFFRPNGPYASEPASMVDFRATGFCDATLRNRLKAAEEQGLVKKTKTGRVCWWVPAYSIPHKAVKTPTESAQN